MKGLRKLITVNQTEIDVLAAKDTLMNDVVIEAYLRIIERRNWYHKVCLPSIYMFDTFFFKDWKEKRYQAVNNRFKKEDIFQNDMLFVPVHLPDRGSRGHWILIVVMVEENTITAYDSCGWNNEAERGTVRDFLTYEATRRNRKVEAWKTVDAPKNIPRQENSYDCGAFEGTIRRKKASGKSIRKNIASVLRAGRVGVEDFRYTEPGDIADMFPTVRGQTSLSPKETATSLQGEASGSVNDPVLEDLLRAAELGYPSMRHVDLFGPLYRPGPSHPAPMEVDVEEDSAATDDLIALIDEAVRDLDVEPGNQRTDDHEREMKVESDRPVSPCLSIAASDSWEVIDERLCEERGDDTVKDIEPRESIEMEAETSSLKQSGTPRGEYDGETRNTKATEKCKRKKRHPKRIRIYSEDGKFKRNSEILYCFTLNCIKWKREDSFNVLAVVKLARRATVADEIAVESAGGAVKDCSCRHLERGSRLIKGLARAGERGSIRRSVIIEVKDSTASRGHFQTTSISFDRKRAQFKDRQHAVITSTTSTTVN
ncbi:hypothetical protein J6590_098221 [Homalodisca vitripennis]|nr:hypothetical protein J6590_098221 [Homalodisca vitripennis]